MMCARMDPNLVNASQFQLATGSGTCSATVTVYQQLKQPQQQYHMISAAAAGTSDGTGRAGAVATACSIG